MADLGALVAAWDGELTILHRARTADAVFVVAVHSTALGPSAGGCRLRSYPALAEAAADAHRLAAAMTAKFAVCDVPLGGGKSVVAVPELPVGDARRRLFHEFGDVVASLRGLYSPAPDMNTGPDDMDVVSERTSHVFCRTPGNGGSGDTAPATAVGVFHGIRATLRRRFGGADPAGRHVVVQGVGAVGARLATALCEAGARVTVADVDRARAEALAARIGAAVVPAEAAAVTPCDLFAPCAVGGGLDAATIARLECAAIAGAANNQLAERADADRLAAAGVLWAPDFVVNAGGVLHGAGRELLGWDDAVLTARIAGIDAALTEIFDAAERSGRTPLDVAESLAAERLRTAGLR